ncbi:MAG: M3 family metallopeptidase [Terriglobales bacterium]
MLPVFPAAAQSSLETRLTEKERQLEGLWAEFWRTDREMTLGNDKLSTVPIRQKIRVVLTEPHFLREIKSARFDDPTLARRRQFFLQEAEEALIIGDQKLARLVEEMEHDEGAIRYRVGGKRLTRAELNRVLAHEPDRELRRNAWMAQEQITALTGARVRKAMKMRKALARRHAGREFSDFMLERKQTDRRRVLDWFEQVRRETEGEFQELLARMRRELKVEKLEPWDTDYYFSTLTGEWEEKLLKPEEGWSTVKKVAAALGLDLERPGLDVVIADITFGGATYPIYYGKEARIVMNKYTGVRFADTLLHESGHGLHFTMMSEPSFLLRANYAEPYGEGLGDVMSLLLYREQFAIGYFGLTAEQFRALRERRRLRALVSLRETIADSLFEFAAYENPDQDLAPLYNRIYSDWLGVDMHGASTWAFDPFYSSGPFYLQSYVLSEMVATQVHHALEQRFGKTWGPEAGAYLRDHFFTRGGRVPLDEIMREGTGEPLTANYLIEALKAPSVAATPDNY